RWFKSTPRNQIFQYVTGNSAPAATVQNCPIRETAHSSPYLLHENGRVGSGSFQEASHDWPIGFALGFHRRVAVLVHRGRNVRVPHELLLNAHGRSGFVQPSTIGVPERVEPDPSKSQLKTRRHEVIGTNRVGVQGPSCHRAW